MGRDSRGAYQVDLTLTAPSAILLPTSAETLKSLSAITDDLRSKPQLTIRTEHIIHGGMYIRTIRIEPYTDLMGSLITKATVLIVHGSCSVLCGDERVELEGYNVLPGCAGRKQLFTTRSRVEMTMVYPTTAQIVEDAENEVFAEADLLNSRQDGSGDTVTITGY